MTYETFCGDVDEVVDAVEEGKCGPISNLTSEGGNEGRIGARMEELGTVDDKSWPLIPSILRKLETQ